MLPYLLFGIFGLLSFAFWGYFQWKGRPTARAAEQAIATGMIAPAGGEQGSRQGESSG